MILEKCMYIVNQSGKGSIMCRENTINADLISLHSMGSAYKDITVILIKHDASMCFNTKMQYKTNTKLTLFKSTIELDLKVTSFSLDISHVDKAGSRTCDYV